MITLNGNRRYWAIGIVVHHTDGGWRGTVDYRDDGWFGDNDADTGQVSTEGRLHTYWPVADGDSRSGLSAVIDALVADAARLGIEFTWTLPDGAPWLYYRGDGEHSDYPPPDGWRELLAAEAARIGWMSYGTEAVSDA